MTFSLNDTGVERADAKIFLDVSRLSSRNFDLLGVLSARPGMSIPQAHEFLERMLVAGLLEIDDRDTVYDMTEVGHSLSQSGLRDRITPEASRIVLEKAIERAGAWNSDPAGFVFITEIKLFGSFLEKKESYGDVDIEIVTTPRKLDFDARRRLAKAPKKVLDSHLYYHNPERALMEHQSRLALRYLGRGLPDLSACPAGVIDRIGASWQEVYAFDPETRKALRPRSRRHPRAFPRKVASKVSHDRSSVLIRPDLKDHHPDIHLLEQVSASRLARFAEGMWHTTWDGERPGASEEDPQLSAQLRFIDDQLPWDLSATGSFDMIREIHRRGIAAGILGSGPIRFDFSKKDMSCIMPSAEGSDLRFRFWHDGASRDLMLLPDVMPAGDTSNRRARYPSSTAGGCISVARSLALPMFEAHDALKIPAGVDVDLGFSWDTRMEEPVLPSLAPMGRAVIGQARSIRINRSDLAPLRDTFKGSRPRRLGLHIEQDVAVTLAAGKEPSIELIAYGRTIYRDDEIRVRNDWSAPDLLDRAQREHALLEAIGSDWCLTVKRSHLESFREADTWEDLFRNGLGPGIRIEEDVPEEAPAFGM